jgi:Domain of unknown function (DUF4262)
VTHARRDDGIGRERDFAVAHLRRLTEMIDEHGWAVQGVTGHAGHPTYAYTVGLFRYTSPELVVLGLPFGVAEDVLNDLGGRVRDGAGYTHGQVIDDLIPPYAAMLLEVTSPARHLLLADCFRDPVPLGPQPLRAWQVVYPDEVHRWPWQSGSGVAHVPLLGPVPTAA